MSPSGEPDISGELEPTVEPDLSGTPDPDISPEVDPSLEADISPEPDNSLLLSVTPEPTISSEPTVSQGADEESDVTAVSEGNDRTAPEADADPSAVGIPEKEVSAEDENGLFRIPENMFAAFFGGCLIGGILVLTIALILRKHARNKQWKEE